jgi:hypothetical protein
MLNKLSVRLITALIGILAMLAIAVFATGTASAAHAAGTAVSGEDQKLVGTVRSINRTQHTFTLQRDGQRGTVTIAFNARTNIEDHSLFVGAHDRVEVIRRANGTLLATEIKPAVRANAGLDQRGRNGSDDPPGDDHGHGRHDG